MPELPEVEVIRRGLLPHLKGKKIVHLRFSGKNLRNVVPIQLMEERLSGSIITDVHRRAKYLLLPTDHGDLLILHLGMTGKLGLFPQGTPTARHDHLFFLLDNGQELRFNDTRRFGSVHLISHSERAKQEKAFFSNTGPEPFGDSCTAVYLKKRANGSSQAVKTFIMNSKIIAGVGNIYANESLFAAGIRPQTPAGKISRKQWQLLLEKIRETLNWAIDCGGSTISDFLNASGQSGYFQLHFQVYARQNEPCLKCSTLIQKRVINGRASYYCPTCQK